MSDTRFESCIKCTVCTTACPVSRVNPSYPGPKQAGPDGERLRLKDGALYDDALKYCINLHYGSHFFFIRHFYRLFEQHLNEIGATGLGAFFVVQILPENLIAHLVSSL